MSAPFAGLYVTYLGATPLQLGFLHSLSSLGSTVLQPIWGFIADKARHKKYLVFIGAFISSLVWFLVATIRDPFIAILLLSLRAFVASLVQPAWSALLGAILPPSIVGSVVAEINQWANIGNLLATLIVGVVPRLIGVSREMEFTIPLNIAAITGVVAAIVILFVEEHEVKVKKRSLVEIERVIVHDKKFLKFVTVCSAYGLFLSLAWPAFTYVMVVEAGFGVFEQALNRVASNVAGIITQNFLRKKINQYNKYRLFAFARTMLVVFPVVYALSPSFWSIIGVTIVGRIFVEIGITALTALLLEIAPKGMVGSYTSFYNLLTGISFTLGSAVGGTLIELFSLYYRVNVAVDIVLYVSAVGRIIFGLLLLKIFGG